MTSTAEPDAGRPPGVAALPTDAPARLGAYQLLGLLGRGGMGSVYLGRDADGQLVAVKVVRPELASDPEFLRLFHREARLARRVARFCTAEVLDVGEDAGRAYLVTEYVDGPTLWDAVGNDGPLSGSQLDRLAVAVATALTAVHDAGTVHRDLKPNNVMLSKSGPLVIDFGIAHALDSTTHLTTDSSGTPAFMAPEQARGEQVTPAADVFAWGGVVVFAATGRPPFGTGRPEILLYRVVHEKPNLDGLPASLRGVVADAMRLDPAGRPTAQELVTRLTSSAGGRLAPDDDDDDDDLPAGPTRLASVVERPGPRPAPTGSPLRKPAARPAPGLSLSPPPRTPPSPPVSPPPPPSSFKSRSPSSPSSVPSSPPPPPSSFRSRPSPSSPASPASVPSVSSLRATSMSGPPSGPLSVSGMPSGPRPGAGSGSGFGLKSGPLPHPDPERPRKRRRGSGLFVAAFVVAALLVASAMAANAMWHTDSPQGQGVEAAPASDGPAEPAVEQVEETTAEVTVPDVTELTRSAAETALHDAGLEPVYADPVSDDAVPMDSVVKQDPAADQTLAKGGEVTLTLSSGAKPIELVKVPDVGGDAEATARAELSDAGFDVQVRRESSSTTATGEAIRTEPAAGTRVRLGGTVTLVVSSGGATTTADLVTVPSDLLGTQYNLAEASLLDAGFQVSRTDEASTEFAKGVVIGTNPSSGEQAARGSTVKLTVSSGPPVAESKTVTVPDVVGMTRPNAEAALRAAGLVPVADSTWDYWNTTVYRTDPVVGTQVAAGSEVLFVASYPPR